MKVCTISFKRSTVIFLLFSVWTTVINAQTWNIPSTSGGGSTLKTFIGTLSTNDVAFYSNNAEWMRLTTIGQLGIGTPTPGQKLEVYGATQNIGIKNTSTTSAGIIFSSTATSQYGQFLFNSGTGSFTLNNTYIGSTSYMNFLLGGASNPTWQIIYAPNAGNGWPGGSQNWAGLQIQGTGANSSRALFMGVHSDPWIGDNQSSTTPPSPGSETKLRVTSLLKVQPFKDNYNLVDVMNNSGTTLFHMDKDLSYFDNIRIGISTTSPDANTKLHVNGAVLIGNTTMPSGYVFSTLGNSSLNGRLQIDNSTSTTPDNSIAGLNISNTSTYSWIQTADTKPLALNPLATTTNNNYVAVGFDPSNPSITVPSGYKLAVAGKVICEELKVKLSGNWPDYVFSKNYNLMPLDSVATYVEANNHLPEVPSAEEVANEGINTGEMDQILLKKIEELTLYMIEQKKAIDELKVENTELKKKVEILEEIK